MTAKKARKPTKRIDLTVADQEDLTVATQGSIFWLTPMSDAGRSWLKEHTPKDAITWQGSTGVEQYDIRNIVEGAIAAGLTVDDRWCLPRIQSVGSSSRPR